MCVEIFTLHSNTANRKIPRRIYDRARKRGLSRANLIQRLSAKLSSARRINKWENSPNRKINFPSNITNRRKSRKIHSNILHLSVLVGKDFFSSSRFRLHNHWRSKLAQPTIARTHSRENNFTISFPLARKLFHNYFLLLRLSAEGKFSVVTKSAKNFALVMHFGNIWAAKVCRVVRVCGQLKFVDFFTDQRCWPRLSFHFSRFSTTFSEFKRFFIILWLQWKWSPRYFHRLSPVSKSLIPSFYREFQV